MKLNIFYSIKYLEKLLTNHKQAFIVQWHKTILFKLLKYHINLFSLNSKWFPLCFRDQPVWYYIHPIKWPTYTRIYQKEVSKYWSQFWNMEIQSIPRGYLYDSYWYEGHYNKRANSFLVLHLTIIYIIKQLLTYND